MQEQTITLTAADGFTLEAFRVTPELPKGGLVILQEIFGVTDFLKSVAWRLAERGLDVIVPALFDRHALHTVVPYAEAERGRTTMQQLDLDKVMLDVEAAVAALREHERICVLGYCWGGGLAIRAAGQLELKGAVAYYGTQLPKHITHGARCPTLFHFADADTHSPPEVIGAVKQAIPDAEIHVYSAGHAFANHDRDCFQADVTALADERTVAFLDRMCSV